MLRAMPVLQVSDVTRSERFYCERLGFVSHGAWGEAGEPPAFCIVQRGKVTLALDRTRAEGAVVPVNQYWAAYLYVEDADALLAELRGRGVTIHREIEDTPYGLRDFDIRDPDGHIIAFGADPAAPGGDPGLME